MYQPGAQLPAKQAFSAAVNTTFGITAKEGGRVPFTLVECNSLISNERQECYSLLFKGPTDQPPVQDTYILENDQLGSMELLLVPVRLDESGLYLEAVMNHLLKR